MLLPSLTGGDSDAATCNTLPPLTSGPACSTLSAAEFHHFHPLVRLWRRRRCWCTVGRWGASNETLFTVHNKAPYRIDFKDIQTGSHLCSVSLLKARLEVPSSSPVIWVGRRPRFLCLCTAAEVFKMRGDEWAERYAAGVISRQECAHLAAFLSW